MLRGERKKLVLHQLSWKTSAPSGGGVPLDDTDCDKYCLPHLGKGAVNLTDGASPYEAFAAGPIICSKGCDRKDCLRRAQAQGKTKCIGHRPRAGRDRYERLYKPLRLAHGVVSHHKEEWSMVKRVEICTGPRMRKFIRIKHGTEVADGAWAEIKSSVPDGVHSSDHERIAEYVLSWAWRARRHGEDLFTSLYRS